MRLVRAARSWFLRCRSPAVCPGSGGSGYTSPPGTRRCAYTTRKAAYMNACCDRCCLHAGLHRRRTGGPHPAEKCSLSPRCRGTLLGTCTSETMSAPQRTSRIRREPPPRARGAARRSGGDRGSVAALARAQAPGDLNCLWLLGAALLAQDKIAESIAILEPVLAGAPGFAHARSISRAPTAATAGPSRRAKKCGGF